MTQPFCSPSPETNTEQGSPLISSSSILTTIGSPTQQNLIAVGIFSVVHRLTATLVRKLPRTDDAFTLGGNIQAIRNEASIYALLGEHPRIVRCLSLGCLEHVDLEFYPHGTLLDYIQRHPAVPRLRWARQIIEAVVLIHSKGIIHSDLALRQFFLDEELNARLGDFGASGYPGQEALGMEGVRHCLPRDPEEENSVASDLFALGSTLYELVVGEEPYRGLGDGVVEGLYRRGEFPSVEGIVFKDVIMGCWRGELGSAEEVCVRVEQLL